MTVSKGDSPPPLESMESSVEASPANGGASPYAKYEEGAQIATKADDPFENLTTLEWITQETYYAQRRCAHVLRHALRKKREFADQEAQNIIFLMAMVARLTFPLADIVDSDPEFVRDHQDTKSAFCQGSKDIGVNQWQELSLRTVYSPNWQPRRFPKNAAVYGSSAQARAMMFFHAEGDESFLKFQEPVLEPTKQMVQRAVLAQKKKRFDKRGGTRECDHANTLIHEEMSSLTLDAIADWVADSLQDGHLPNGGDTAEGVFSYQLLHLHFTKKEPPAKAWAARKPKFPAVTPEQRATRDIWLKQNMGLLMGKSKVLLEKQEQLAQLVEQKEFKHATTYVTLQWVISNAVHTKCVIGNCEHAPDVYVMNPFRVVTCGVDFLKAPTSLEVPPDAQAKAPPDLLDEFLNRGIRFDSSKARQSCLMNQCEDEIYFITHLILIASWWGTQSIGYPAKNSRGRNVWVKLSHLLTLWLDKLLADADVETKNREVALELACCLLIFAFNNVQIPVRAFALCFKYISILQLLTRHRESLRYEKAGNKFTTYVGHCPIGRGRLHVDYHTHILLSMFLQMYRLCALSGKLQGDPAHMQGGALELVHHYQTSAVRAAYRRWVFHDWRRKVSRKRRAEHDEENEGSGDQAEEQESEEEEIEDHRTQSEIEDCLPVMSYKVGAATDSEEDLPLQQLRAKSSIRSQVKKKFKKDKASAAASRPIRGGKGKATSNKVHTVKLKTQARGRKPRNKESSSSSDSSSSESSSSSDSSSSSSDSDSSSDSSSSSSSASNSDSSSSDSTSDDSSDSDASSSSSGSDTS